MSSDHDRLERRWLVQAWRVLKVRQRQAEAPTRHPKAPKGTQRRREANFQKVPILGCYCRCASCRRLVVFIHHPAKIFLFVAGPSAQTLGRAGLFCTNSSFAAVDPISQASLHHRDWELIGTSSCALPGTSSTTLPSIWTLTWSPSINQPPWLTFPLPGSTWAIYHATVRSPDSVLLFFFWSRRTVLHS